MDGDYKYAGHYERGMAATAARALRDRLRAAESWTVEYERDGEWWLWGTYCYEAVARDVTRRLSEEGVRARFGKTTPGARP